MKGEGLRVKGKGGRVEYRLDGVGIYRRLFCCENGAG